MIRNRELLEQWEKKYLKQEAPDFFHNLRLFEGLYREARALGVFPLKAPLEGLETKIRLAKAINVSGTA